MRKWVLQRIKKVTWHLWGERRFYEALMRQQSPSYREFKEIFGFDYPSFLNDRIKGKMIEKLRKMYYANSGIDYLKARIFLRTEIGIMINPDIPDRWHRWSPEDIYIIN